jgi:hypothetical protein
MKDQRIRILVLGLVLLLSTDLFASNVRTVAVNNDAMAPIFLKMGKSTVLRFVDKPKKVVIGNQNYYGLEFIENDVAIQPIGAVGTNLFVYTEHHTYGFLLPPGERYDDLVFVRWKYPQVGKTDGPRPVAAKIVSPKLSFMVGEGLKIRVDKIQGPSTFGLHLIDCTIENVGKTELDISSTDLRATRSGKALENQSVVIERDKLKPHEKAKARVVLKLGTKDDFSIEGKLKGASGKIAVARKFL